MGSTQNEIDARLVPISRGQAISQFEWGLPVALVSPSTPENLTWYEQGFMRGGTLPEGKWVYLIRPESCYSCDGIGAVTSFEDTPQQSHFTCPVCRNGQVTWLPSAKQPPSET